MDSVQRLVAIDADTISARGQPVVNVSLAECPTSAKRPAYSVSVDPFFCTEAMPVR